MPKVVPEYKENAKRRILEAAMDVIAERGCDRMTIDDVAKRLGVTKGAVYWYFPNKEELLTAVLKEVLNSIQADIRKCTFESYYNKTAEETMIQIFDRFVLAYSERRELFFEMFSLANRDSDARRAIREYYDGVTATFEEAIRKEKKRNYILTETDAHTLALLFTALYTGLQNYEMAYAYQRHSRDLWIEGMRILLKPSYSGTYGEEEK